MPLVYQIKGTLISSKYLLVFLAVLLVSCKKDKKNTGHVFGTTYTIIHDSKSEYQMQFDSLFYVINKSLSTYQNNSIISKINRNESVIIDKHFEQVFLSAQQVYAETNGYFDPTVGQLVNAWDFGPETHIKTIDSLVIDSLMQFVGYSKLNIKCNRIIKQPQTYLDFNAIAKGYAVDVIAEFLNAKSSINYLVEIGGEVRSKGINNDKQQPWVVGIDKPNFEGQQAVFKTLKLRDQAMATSGIYRKFKVDNYGNRYAHILNPKTGYPSKTPILSVSVIAKNCMLADAYATAFQVMGIESVQDFLKKHPEIKAYIIYYENDKLKTIALNKFPI